MTYLGQFPLVVFRSGILRHLVPARLVYSLGGSPTSAESSQNVPSSTYSQARKTKAKIPAEEAYIFREDLRHRNF